ENESCAGAFLPGDVTVKILSWLPVKALLRFRCVCKSWKSLLLDLSFVKLHLQRSYCRDTPVLFTLLNSNSKEEQCSLHYYCSMQRLLDNPLSAIDDGDLPFNQKPCRFWNPATRLRSKKSPCIMCYIHTLIGFGYNDSSDTYKVVAVVKKSRAITELRVCCLGDNCWRKIATWTDFLRAIHTKGLFMSNTLNWVGRLYTTHQNAIFSFDIRKETYRYLSLPVDVDVLSDDTVIGVLGGCLCLSHDYKRTRLAIWQMKEFGVEKSRTPLKKVSYEHLQISTSSSWMAMHANSDVRLVASKSEFGLVLYNRRENRVKPNGMFSKTVILESTQYVESLVLPYRI
ncbi:F-box protein CPR1, partial [Glycine soja]